MHNIRILFFSTLMLAFGGCSLDVDMKVSAKIGTQTLKDRGGANKERREQKPYDASALTVKVGFGRGTLASRGDGYCYVITVSHIIKSGLPNEIEIDGRIYRITRWAHMPRTDTLLLKTVEKCTSKNYLSIKRITAPQKGERAFITGRAVIPLVPQKTIPVTFTGSVEHGYYVWSAPSIVKGYSGAAAYSVDGKYFGPFAFVDPRFNAWVPKHVPERVGYFGDPLFLQNYLARLRFK